MLFDAVTARETDLTLQTAHYGYKHIDENPTTISSFYEKGDDSVDILIKEYDSAEAAAASFDTPRSYGRSEKFDALGDEGEKIYGRNGFIQLTFRKGNFRVTVSHKNEKTGRRDEKTAGRFAEYALEAVKNLAAKQ